MIFKKILNKKVLGLSLLALFIAGSNNSKCFNLSQDQIQQALGITTATALATTCSTIYCWYKKRQVSKELEQLRSGEIKKEKDQKLISEISQYINTVNQKFESEILLAKSKANLYQEEYVERWIAIAKQKRTMVESVSLAYSAISAYKNDLEICISECDKTNPTDSYVIKAREIFKELITLENLFKEMTQSIKSQLNFIDLCLLTDRSNLSEYSRELGLSKHFFNQQYIVEIDKIIRSKGEAGNQFPYLSYAHKLKNDIDHFKDVIEKLKGMKLLIFQERIINQANELTMALSHLLENVVSINFYQDEQKRKPEFDKQQRLLAADLKEREEKILREKQIIETKLLNEKNKEMQLANERAKIDRDKQALIVQERNINYEREKILSGQWLKEELAKEQLKNEKLIKIEVEKAKDKAKKDLVLKEQELATIKYQMENLDYQKRQNDSRLNDVYRNIALCKQYIQNLQSKLNTPPCNPESVDGLADYLTSLKDLANNAVRSV